MFGIDSLQDRVHKAKDCARVCLIVYEIVSMFDIDSSRFCPCLALIVYKILSVKLKIVPVLIVYEIESMFDIDSSRDCACVWY